MSYRDRLIAIVGVSDREEKYGTRIFKDLIRNGYSAVAINPKGGEVFGRVIYKSLKDLLETPQIVITVVPPPITERIVDECKEIGVSEIWMQPGSESEAAIKKAKDYGMLVTHSACFMIENKIW